MNTKEIKLVVTEIGYRKEQNNRGIICCITFVVLLLLAPQVMAQQRYLSTFETTYPDASGSRIDACNLCHNSPGGGEELNSYGLSYTSSGGKFASIENIDSDGDGITNVQEINSLTFPGDATDIQTTTRAPKSPGFEAIGTIAAVFVVVVLAYRHRKNKQ